MNPQTGDDSAQRVATYLDALRRHVGEQASLARRQDTYLVEGSDLAAHGQALEAYVQALGTAREGERAGRVTRLQSQPELDRLWQAMQGGDAFARVAAWHDSIAAERSTPGRDWLRAAFPLQADELREWQTTSGLLGTTALRPLRPGNGGDGGGGGAPAPAPAPVPPPHSPPPLHVCLTAPYAFSLPNAATSGVAVVSTAPLAATVNGDVDVISSTIAPILAGGGTDSRALVGGDISWGPGFGLMDVQATIRLDNATLFAVTIIGGATASAELQLSVTLSDGQTFSTALGLGAAVAPLLWHTNLDLRGTYTVKLGGIPINGPAGSARVMAGVHDNTAAVGVGGSSGATTFISGQVVSICADLR